jgi:hypothetical protein
MIPTEKDRQFAERIYIGCARLRADLTKNRYPRQEQLDLIAKLLAESRAGTTGRTSTPGEFAAELVNDWMHEFDSERIIARIAARDAELAPKPVTGQTFEEWMQTQSFSYETSGNGMRGAWNAALATQNASIEKLRGQNRGLIMQLGTLDLLNARIEAAVDLAKSWQETGKVRSLATDWPALGAQCLAHADAILRALGRKVEP